jgi:hypothetical protein
MSTTLSRWTVAVIVALAVMFGAGLALRAAATEERTPPAPVQQFGGGGGGGAISFT